MIQLKGKPYAVQRAMGQAREDKESTQVEQGGAPEVQIHGYRGIRTIDGQKIKEMDPSDSRVQEAQQVMMTQPLLYSGHVGVSLDKGKTIWGLTPEIPEGMPAATAMGHLFGHTMAFPGVVKNDKPVFDQATRYHKEKDYNTEVHVMNSPVTHSRQAELVGQIQQMAGAKPGSHGVYYSFPLRDAEDGQYYKDAPGPDGTLVSANKQSNCATFPGQLGLELPEASGNLRNYIPALEKKANGG
jgi:hypothetical protein